MAISTYTPNPEVSTRERIAALLALTSDEYEIAMTLVDEDEAAFPGSWAQGGLDRNGAISEYLHEIRA